MAIAKEIYVTVSNNELHSFSETRREDDDLVFVLREESELSQLKNDDVFENNLSQSDLMILKVSSNALGFQLDEKSLAILRDMFLLFEQKRTEIMAKDLAWILNTEYE